ncbi:hypothetical protein LS684_04395 [Cytobacillus spongiae]|uniref:hypothetical protein n=1 Tax=Cytobacillus spongiae TaxID=2901381 RepID=UPI001F315D89|nr:hypothetical protein [Cytobacillus spongiae]UII56711.1 hypothetical protein LS684_04395 [Cytobacillus spongiae]
MNEKTKTFMREQIENIVQNLNSKFGIPIYEDEPSENEEESLDVNGYNFFVYETSDFQPTSDTKRLSQNIYVYYHSENQDNVDEQTIDIISSIIKVKAVSFIRSRKERLQMKDTDRYMDRVTLTFKRLVPIEC